MSSKEQNLAKAIRERFAPYGGVELEIPQRDFPREPPDFSEEEHGVGAPKAEARQS